MVKTFLRLHCCDFFQRPCLCHFLDVGLASMSGLRVVSSELRELCRNYIGRTLLVDSYSISTIFFGFSVLGLPFCSLSMRDEL